jgi:spore coat protein H
MIRSGSAMVLLLMLLTHIARAADAPGSAKDQPPADLFKELPRFEISIDSEGIASLRFEPRNYVKAQIREGSNVYTNVAIKLKGARGSFRPLGSKSAFTLNFDKFAPDQEFHGLDKIHLNNSVQDPTYFNEIICSQLFLAAGVPTARAIHARVVFNGEDTGLYVLKEGYDKRFLKRHFGNADGNLYDGGFLNDINDLLEKDSGDGPNDWSDLDLLVQAANQSDLGKRLIEVEKVLDLDRFITFTAMEMLTCHWDGYTQNHNNYRLYRNPGNGKFVFIPHGMDQVFEDVGFPLIPGDQRARRGWRQGMLTRQVMAIPEVQRRYIVRMGQLLNDVFTVEKIDRIVSEAENRVRIQAGREEPRLATYLSGQARYMRQRVAARIQSARAQYLGLSKMLTPEQK